MTRDELFEKHMNQVNKIAWSFSRTCGHDFEDLKSEGLLGLCKAFEKFDKNRQLQLSTLVHTCVRNHLTTYVKSEYRHKPTEPIELESNIFSGERRYEFLTTLETLGIEAKEIAGIIFSGPAEFLEIPLSSSPNKIRQAIRKYLKEVGFTGEEIRDGIKEIKSCLK